MEPHEQLTTLVSLRPEGNQTPWPFYILTLIWAIRGGSHSTSPQPVPAVNLRFKCVDDPRDRGSPWDTSNPNPYSNAPFSNPTQLRGFTFTRFWLPVSPFQVLWSVWSVVTATGVSMLYKNCTVDLIHKLASSISTGREKWKRGTDKCWLQKTQLGMYPSLITAALSKSRGIWFMFGPGIPFVWQRQQQPVWEAHCTVTIKNVNLKKKQQKNNTYTHVYTSNMKMSHSISMYNMCGS